MQGFSLLQEPYPNVSEEDRKRMQAAELSGRILGGKNEETLRKWLKLAARAESVEEFEKSMQCFTDHFMVWQWR